MRRLLRATLLLYPGPVRRRHGAELECLVNELIERDGRSRPAVMGRLAVDGLSQRLSSRAAMWAMLATLTLTSLGGLAVSDIAAASAHVRPAPARSARSVRRHADSGPALHRSVPREAHRIQSEAAGIIAP